MTLKYYYDLMSQPCRALYIFLKINKIPYEPCTVALRKAEHLTEEFEKINILKKVPVIIHNGFKLTESVGILRYLSREFEVPDHWYPKSSQAQAQVDEFLEWQHLNLRAHGSLVFMHKVLFPLMKQRDPDENKIAHYRNELDKTLSNMEKMFLDKTPFLNRTEISIADLLAVCEVEQPIAAGFDVLNGHPITKTWMERVKEQTQPHYKDAHVFIEKLKQNMTTKSNL